MNKLHVHIIADKKLKQYCHYCYYYYYYYYHYAVAILLVIVIVFQNTDMSTKCEHA